MLAAPLPLPPQWSGPDPANPSSSLGADMLAFRGFGTEYWWCWVAIAFNLGSVALNVALFTLAVSYLPGELTASERMHWCCGPCSLGSQQHASRRRGLAPAQPRHSAPVGINPTCPVGRTHPQWNAAPRPPGVISPELFEEYQMSREAQPPSATALASRPAAVKAARISPGGAAAPPAGPPAGPAVAPHPAGVPLEEAAEGGMLAPSSGSASTSSPRTNEATAAMSVSHLPGASPGGNGGSWEDGGGAGGDVIVGPTVVQLAVRAGSGFDDEGW